MKNITPLLKLAAMIFIVTTQLIPTPALADNCTSYLSRDGEPCPECEVDFCCPDGYYFGDGQACYGPGGVIASGWYECFNCEATD